MDLYLDRANSLLVLLRKHLADSKGETNNNIGNQLTIILA